MVHTKYKFTPQDIAVYLLIADLPRSREDKIIEDFFQEYNDEIVFNYRNDFLELRRQIHNSMILLEMSDEEYAETQLIMRELQIEKTEYEPNYFGAYFKLIKLQLLYSGKDYQRIKLRTLLNDFGYKRRTEALVNSITRAMKALNLQPYLKQYEPCDLAEITLDQMVIIRLN
ncbi:MAG: hypothetical protein K6A79_09155 [Ruminococcus sp.]|jgi:hypothetical protein|nr:hypothetical protein [Ruminococcus sp.]